MSKRITPAQAARIDELAAQGVCDFAIAREVGVAPTTVRRRLDPEQAAIWNAASRNEQPDADATAARALGEALERLGQPRSYSQRAVDWLDDQFPGYHVRMHALPQLERDLAGASAMNDIV